MTATTKFDAMGKEELRAACRAAGISYSKLNNDGMRAALAAKEEPELFTKVSAAVLAAESAADDKEIAAWNAGAATPEGPEGEEEEDECGAAPSGANPFVALFGTVEVPNFKGTVTKSSDGKVVDLETNSPKAEKAVASSKVEKTPAPVIPTVSRKGYKIQKEREVRNGVKRPSEGTVCEKIWAYLDENKATASSKLDSIADALLWDRTTMRCQFYTWRKFNGIRGRQNA